MLMDLTRITGENMGCNSTRQALNVQWFEPVMLLREVQNNAWYSVYESALQIILRNIINIISNILSIFYVSYF